MARTHARILTSIWNDGSDFTLLDADQQRVFFVLLSQGDLSPCGVLTYSPKRIARLANNTPLRKIITAVAGLESARYIVLDHETEELTFRTFLRHDGVLAHPNALKGAARSFGTIHSRTIRQAVTDQLPPGIRAIWPEGVLRISPKDLGAILTTATEPSTQPSQEGSQEGSTHPSTEASTEGSRLARGRVPAQARAVPAPAPAPSPPPQLQHPEPPTRTPRRNGTNPTRKAAAAAEEEDPRIHQATTTLAHRALAHRTGPTLTDRAAWLTHVATERHTEHAPAAHQLLTDHPHLTADQLADRLEPDPDLDDGTAEAAEQTRLSNLEADQLSRKRTEAAAYRASPEGQAAAAAILARNRR